MAIEITDVDDACLWGPTVEKIFIDNLVDEVNKGNMASGQFGSKTWAKILELQIKSKRKYLIKQIKQKFNRLRTKYREFAELLKQTRFGWDHETNTVVASEEIWQNYLRFHRSAASGLPNTDDEREMENEFDRIDAHDIDENDSTSCSRLVDDVFKRSTKNSTTTSTERRAKRQRSQQMSDAIVAWTEVAKVRAEATLAKAKKYKSTTEGGGSQNHEFSLTNCMQILEGMEEVSDDAYMKAVEKFKDPDWREIFINMSTIRKRAWLDRL
ncbi:L10-interacting MYB domain-containing protein-like [Humulus lupulus]|uniref:L10-interacting MYB domain-containing protein-like n=1 Tax=Humulus lupulus TaxID=3486 RepID=UPI002B4070E0|nr:L10-interacting MYB domain-containing protein-like [Humulus lupulus]